MRTLVRRILARFGYVKTTPLTQDEADHLIDVAHGYSAANAFVEAWTTSGLAYELVGYYDCTLTCSEAESMADLFRAFGYENTADDIIASHSESDECGDSHHSCDDCTSDDEYNTAA
ncbi:hypothetical protein [Kitasatospora sp. NPDC058218]|uniref:hypothetical protein n=1 Tax=Kitasatospora sp. NPDC058218 TaxID=3346385 RepID=UPI0036DB02DE